MTQRIYCNIEGVFKGFRELQTFRSEVSLVWSKTGEIFPMFDEDTGEIFECGFNKERAEIVAFGEISAKEFRARLEHIARDIIMSDVQKAITEASKKASVLLSEGMFYEIYSEL
jgi:hypothetical protein